jgi:hypothetical protein
MPRFYFVLWLGGSLSLSTPAATGTNEWTKTTSGYWEENYWSLGELPSIANDLVAFRNPGFKALAIGANTTANYPDSLSIRNLAVFDPANLLLLNYAGLEVPLNVAEDFTLGPGASFLSYYSSLSASNFNVSGIATFAEQSMATIGTLWVHGGSTLPAELNISNAVISSDAFLIGSQSGMGGIGTVNHYAGTNRVTGPNGLYVTDGSTYDLSNGTLIARSAQIASGGAQFNMANGFVQIDGRILLVNGTLSMQGGRIEAGEINTMTGRFTQSGGSNIVANIGVAYASQFQGAEHFLSGGTLVSSNVSVGDGFMVTGTFEQSGGIHNNSGEIKLWGYERTVQHHGSGFYRLSAGLLTANRINVFGGGFTQSGGSNRVGDIVLDFAGGFSLRGGSLDSSNCLFTAQTGSLPYYSPAVFVQSNGTHTVHNQMIIEKSTSPFSSPRGGIYYLDGGTLISQTVNVWDRFAQFGGMHTNRQYLNVSGNYTLTDGYLLSPSLALYGGSFIQTGGTNRADNLQTSLKSVFYLGGGVLSTLNSRVTSAGVTDRTNRSSFVQSNGNHLVQNTLTIDPGFYRLYGGSLAAPNIGLYPDSELWLEGGTIDNPGSITMYEAALRARTEHRLGKLVIASGPLSQFPDEPLFSALDFEGASTVLRFLDSHDVSSAWNSRLAIQNWNGSTNGGGTDQLYVGTTSQGLTAAQLDKIFFDHPAGLPPGNYPARILPSGEIVPAAPPSITFARASNKLVLSWTGDYQLRTATNIAGPFVNVVGATSPYTNSFNDPQRYFELRSPGYWRE